VPPMIVELDEAILHPGDERLARENVRGSALRRQARGFASTRARCASGNCSSDILLSSSFDRSTAPVVGAWFSRGSLELYSVGFATLQKPQDPVSALRPRVS
jgi:hypothetical protein